MTFLALEQGTKASDSTKSGVCTFFPSQSAYLGSPFGNLWQCHKYVTIPAPSGGAQKCISTSVTFISPGSVWTGIVAAAAAAAAASFALADLKPHILVSVARCRLTGGLADRLTELSPDDRITGLPSMLRPGLPARRISNSASAKAPSHNRTYSVEDSLLLKLQVLHSTHERRQIKCAHAP